MKRRLPELIALLLIVVYSVLFTLASISERNKLHAPGDLAAIWQSVYNLAFHGFPGSSFNCSVHRYWDSADFSDFLKPVSPDLMRGNQLGIHFHALIFPIALVARIFPSPILLLIIQSAAIGAGAWFFWKLAFLLSRSAIVATGLLGCLLVNPFLHGLHLNEFHFDSFAPLVIFGAAYYLERSNYRAFWLIAIASLLAKESFPLVLAGFGLVVISKGKEYWLKGLIILSVAFGWFIILIHWIMPSLSYFHTYLFSSIYGSKLGGSPTEILLTSIKDPRLFLNVLGTPQNISYLWLLLISTGILGLLKPRYILICSGILFINLVSSNAAMKIAWGQYNAAVFPAFFVALAYFFAKARTPAYNAALLSVSLIACLWCSLHSSPAWENGRWHLQLWQPTFASAIPPEASVSSEDRYSDFLASRVNFTLLPVNIGQCDYVVKNAAGMPWYMNEKLRNDLRNYLDKEFAESGRVGDILILRRK